jgi:ADP-ribose pyrophosphatase YjhB (NUDIX family)
MGPSADDHAMQPACKAAATLTRMLLQPHRIQHCRVCGAKAEYRVPEGDNRERATCTACGEIHYENPLNVVGTVPVWGDQVLLCRRNIEPRYGMWTLPAGFMELGENTADGALRETIEEAGAKVEMQGLFSVLNVVRVGQVHFFYRARMLDASLDPGPETIEARLFREDEIPWDELAFRTVRQTLELFFEDRRRGHFGVHEATVG